MVTSINQMSADDALVECPICGAFLETDEANTHAESHFASNAPTPSNPNAPASEKVSFDDDEDNAIEISSKEFSKSFVPEPPNFQTPAARDAFVKRPVSLLSATLGKSPHKSYLSRPATLHCDPDDFNNWTCGFRNIQIMLSSLPNFTGPIPDIQTIQKTIEAGWREGIDPYGRDHFGGRLVGKNVWIGTTEAWVFFLKMGYRTKIFDFHRPTGPNGEHPMLIDLVRKYFEGQIVGDFTSRKNVDKEQQGVEWTGVPPLYFQHQGHSRTITGLECLPTGDNLLLLDPSYRNPRQISDFRIGQRELKKNRQYSILAVLGKFASAEEARLAGRTLASVRIP